jgi:hypothetical protein
MAVTRLPLPAGFGNAVFASQSRKWLMERIVYSPQVRRFFGEKLPRLATANGNFLRPEGLAALPC